MVNILNNVVLIGRLTRDPELRYIPNSGTPVSTFTLAVDKGLSREKKQEMESRNQPTADFINIVVWGKVAENVANFVNKGKLVGVQGRIQSRSYDAKDGTRKYITEVVANNVEFLEWGDNTNKQGTYSDNNLDYPEMDGFHPTDNDDIPF